ncbi:unnamed protein product, partial [marine sediment metagenome]
PIHLSLYLYTFTPPEERGAASLTSLGKGRLYKPLTTHTQCLDFDSGVSAIVY